jgi:hypothetical protein
VILVELLLALPITREIALAQEVSLQVEGTDPRLVVARGGDDDAVLLALTMKFKCV